MPNPTSASAGATTGKTGTTGAASTTGSAWASPRRRSPVAGSGRGGRTASDGRKWWKGVITILAVVGLAAVLLWTMFFTKDSRIAADKKAVTSEVEAKKTPPGGEFRPVYRGGQVEHEYIQRWTGEMSPTWFGEELPSRAGEMTRSSQRGVSSFPNRGIVLESFWATIDDDSGRIIKLARGGELEADGLGDRTCTVRMCYWPPNNRDHEFFHVLVKRADQGKIGHHHRFDSD